MTATDSASRRRLLVEALVEARQTTQPVAFVAEDRRIMFEDRTLRVEATDAERDRLETLCDEYRVLKIQQPETRKAADNVVYLSAVTDPKHLADFIDALFRDVYTADADYELTTDRPD